MISAGDQIVAMASRLPTPTRPRSARSTCTMAQPVSIGIAISMIRPAVSSPNRAFNGRTSRSAPRLPDQAHRKP